MTEFLSAGQKLRSFSMNGDHSSVVLNSLGSCAWALFILRGGGRRGLCVVGAAGLARVDGRGPLIQRCVLPFLRNVAAAVLLRGPSLQRVQSQAALYQRLWVWVLDLDRARENTCVILMKLNHLRYFTVELGAFPSLTPGFTGSGTCGMLSIFWDGTAAGTPMCFGLTVKQTHKTFQHMDSERWGLLHRAGEQHGPVSVVWDFLTAKFLSVPSQHLRHTYVTTNRRTDRQPENITITGMEA